MKRKRIIKKILFFIFTLIPLTQILSACPRCRAQVAEGIYNPDFGLNLFLMLLPLLVLMAFGFGLYYVDNLIEKSGGR
jgi:hypothetical protein